MCLVHGLNGLVQKVTEVKLTYGLHFIDDPGMN